MKKYLSLYRIESIKSIILVAIIVTTSLLQPSLLRTIINEGIMNVDENNIANPDMDVITSYGVILVIIAVIGLIAGIINTIYAANISQKVGASMRNDAFKNLQDFSYSDLEKFDLSNVIVRLTNDITQIQNVVMMLFQSLVRLPLLFIGAFILAVIAIPSLWWIIIVEVVLMFIVMSIINKFTFPMFSNYQKKVDRINTVVKENFVGIRVIKSFVKEQKEISKFSKESDDLSKLNFKIGSNFSILIPFIMLIANLAIVAVIFFSKDAVLVDPSVVGDIVAFINYLTLIMMALMIGGFLAMQAGRAAVSNKRIMELIEFESSIKYIDNDIVDIEGDIEFKNVNFKYPNDEAHSLENISFKIYHGETIGIVGATGSGKSTIVNLIARLYDSNNGEILISGFNIKDIPKTTLRTSIAYVLQRPILFSGTIKSNISEGNLKATQEELVHSSTIAQAKGFISNLPYEYESPVLERGVNFSGGQKQRISIARGLIKNPKILILDDSTSALDANSERLVQEGLKEHFVNCTKVIISQKISSVVNANKILVLDKGKLIDCGTHIELVERCELYKEILATQKGRDN